VSKVLSIAGALLVVISILGFAGASFLVSNDSGAAPTVTVAANEPASSFLPASTAYSAKVKLTRTIEGCRITDPSGTELHLSVKDSTIDNGDYKLIYTFTTTTDGSYLFDCTAKTDGRVVIIYPSFNLGATMRNPLSWVASAALIAGIVLMTMSSLRIRKTAKDQRSGMQAPGGPGAPAAPPFTDSPAPGAPAPYPQPGYPGAYPPAPQGFGTPPAGYGQPQAAPPPYGAPAPGYQTPPAPPSTPPPGLGTPPAGYGTPPAAYDTVVGYDQPPAGPTAPPQPPPAYPHPYQYPGQA